MKTLSFANVWKRFLMLGIMVLICLSIALNRGILYADKSRELAVIDRKISHKEKILDNLPRGTRVVLLDSNENALDALTRILAREKDVRVLRVFSHGSPGQLFLNGEVIDKMALIAHGKDVMGWAEALDEEADILLYGCDVARGDGGRAFVDELARLTGADVAASINPTGGRENQWALEYASGNIEAQTLLIEDYLYYLANQIVSNNNDSGAGSLRQAITDVAAGDQITFALGSGSETIVLVSELVVDKNLTIDGDNADGSGTDITIDGGDGCRVININSGTVTLEKMTITNGKVNDKGGGIYNAGTLTVNNCTISGNTAENNNDVYGGGIYNKGTLTIENSTISGNTVKDTGSNLARGGGIYSLESLTIQNSTISGNTVQSGHSAFGGGVYTESAVFNMNSSTVSGNTATGEVASGGGGIYLESSSSSKIINCTISGNTVSGSGTKQGAGMLQSNSAPIVRNSIIALNTNAATNYDFYGSGHTDGDYNAVGTSNSPAAWSATNTWLDTDADGTFTKNGGGTGLLNLSTTLADNGGPTQTLALASDSFAAASATTGIPHADNWNQSPDIDGYSDQRAVVRMPGQNTSIGAYSENYTAFYYHMSASNGDWSNVNTWQQSSDGSTWQAAAAVPDITSLGTTIRENHTVTVTENLTTDQTAIESGANLEVDSGVTLTIANGDGIDLTVVGNLDNDGALTFTDGSTVTFSGSSDSSLSGAGTWTFKTVTVNKDAVDTTLDINTGSDVTIATALNVTQGTVDLSGWTHDLKLGGTLTIYANGRWIKQGNNSYFIQFYGDAFTLDDQSSNGPQNLGHVRVD